MNCYIVYDILEFHPPDEHFLLQLYTSNQLWAKHQIKVEKQNEQKILRDYRQFCKQHMIFPMNLPRNPDIHGLLTDPIKYISLKKLLQTSPTGPIAKFLPKIPRSKRLPLTSSSSPTISQLPPSSQNYLKLLIFRACLAKGALQLADLFNHPPKDVKSLNRDMLILLKYNQITPEQIPRVLEYALQLGFNATNRIPPECEHKEEIEKYIFHYLIN